MLATISISTNRHFLFMVTVIEAILPRRRVLRIRIPTAITMLFIIVVIKAYYYVLTVTEK